MSNIEFLILIKDKIMIGERLKKIRLENDISQTKLAKKIGVLPRTISYWESEKYKIPAKFLLKIAKMYKKDLSFFEEYQDSTPLPPQPDSEADAVLEAGVGASTGE